MDIHFGDRISTQYSLLSSTSVSSLPFWIQMSVILLLRGKGRLTEAKTNFSLGLSLTVTESRVRAITFYRRSAILLVWAKEEE